MPEILTESFCERCGTRYTFESVAPRKTKRIGQFRTLSKGVKNWVMSDDSSLDEAMAEARSDDEREQTAQQLDAFHSTFNFCMNCRQYTCSNCWNGAEGRCLSCAPSLGQEVLGTQFPTVVGDAVRLDAEAWPEVDLAATNDAPELDEVFAGNGVHHDETNGTPAESNGTAPESNAAVQEEDAGFDPFARLAFLTVTGETAAPAWPAEETAGDAAAIDGGTDLIGLPTPVASEPAESVASVAEVAAEAVDAAPVEEVAAEAVDAASVDAAAPDLPEDLDGRAAAMSAHTTDLLGRFRPGQNIDAELEAYEAELDAQERATDEVEVVGADGGDVAEVAAAAAVVASVDAAPDGEAALGEPPAAETEPDRDAARIAAAVALAAAAAITPVPAAEAPRIAPAPEPAAEPVPEPVVAEPEAAAAEAERIAAEPEAEPVAAEAEPVAAEAEPVAAPVAAEAEPVAAEAEPLAAEPESVAAEPPVREDRIEQPTWRIYAPDGQDAGTPPPIVPGGPVAPQPSLPAQASATPEWPSRPELEESPSMALLANRARAGDDALWAASAREVLGPAAGTATAPAAGVQPCSSCGLSLSANARFCRRCGTRQG